MSLKRQDTIEAKWLLPAFILFLNITGVICQIIFDRVTEYQRYSVAHTKEGNKEIYSTQGTHSTLPAILFHEIKRLETRNSVVSV